MTRQQQLVLGLLGAALVWALLRRGSISATSLLLFATLIPSIIVHEVSHGVAALAFGDDTAKRAGRLTLNPLPHIDPFGTIILPAMLVLLGGVAFGYAKPVPVAVNRLRSPRNQGLIVSLVGPATNIVIAVVCGLVLHVVGIESTSSGALWVRALFFLGYVNVILAAFNLIPIPPLDGSGVVERLLPARAWPQYLRLRQYSMLLLFGLVFLVPGLLDRVFHPALQLWFHLLR